MGVARLTCAAIAAAAVLFGAGSASADAPVKIRIAWVVPIGNWASIIYEKTDLMTHYGKSYVVEPVHFQSTPTMITALGAGELEIADLAYSSFAIAVENAGMTDLRIIADEAVDGAPGYFTAKYVVLKDGPVKTIDDLKGKVLATVGRGSAVDIPVRAVLRKHGLEDPRDYTTVEGPFPSLGAMLLDHKVDFIPAVAPFVYEPRLMAGGRTLFTVRDALGGETEFIIWAAHNDFLQKNRAAMVDFMEDAVRAVHFFRDPKNHDAAVQIAAKIAKQPLERVGYVFTKADDYQDPNMLPNLTTFQRAIDTQQQAGFLKEKLEAKNYADLSIVKEAAARIK
jgi:sulfonate transport system substrate-binding protein